MGAARDRLELVKLTMDVITPMVVVGCLVLALFNIPFLARHLGGMLNNAGLEVEKAEVAGVTLRNIRPTVDALSTAQGAIRDLSRRYGGVRNLLQCQRSGDCTAAQRAQVDAVVGGPAIPPAAEAALRRSDQAIAAVEQLVERAERDVAASNETAATGRWLVVRGSDRDAAAARDEVARARRGGRSAEILLRGAWYTTVVPFASEAEARDAVAGLSRLMGRQAYARAQQSWCPNSEPADGFSRCAAGPG